MKTKFQTPTGMHDILPLDQKYYDKVLETGKEIAEFYNFQRIETPVLEMSELFEKGTGETTDIVQKQMYAFKTKGGDSLTFRPEGTPPVVRAYLEHGMFNYPQPVKLWYYGPFFRYERPQAGRQRQFWQMGLEVIGEKNSIIDAQIIQIYYNILKELKLTNLVVEVNCIGDQLCRPYYRKTLASYLRSKDSSLCVDCKRRVKENPLRILDCKDEKCQAVRAHAPQMIDHLCEECKQHFKEVLEYLDEIGLPYRLNPYLVRGLDYYTKTVFEIFQEGKEGQSQMALGGGGRYDCLVKLLGGKETPAIGGSLGVDRVVQAIKDTGIVIDDEKKVKVFLAQLGYLGKKKSLKLFEELRRANILVGESFDRDSLKSQLKIADKYGVQLTLFLGQKEALEGTVLIRNMETGKQETVKLENAVVEIKKRLKK
ncbi:MAG: histidine--tRNA ligase [Candidatus Nealsonbacteria bacterium]|nr:histidine--tRNA ligase [Candidatus Nealsonbacteria bacterium]